MAKIVKATLLIEVETEFDDTESSEETVRYLIEQDLEEIGWNVTNCELAEVVEE